MKTLKEIKEIIKNAKVYKPQQIDLDNNIWIWFEKYSDGGSTVELHAIINDDFDSFFKDLSSLLFYDRLTDNERQEKFTAIINKAKKEMEDLKMKERGDQKMKVNTDLTVKAINKALVKADKKIERIKKELEILETGKDFMSQSTYEKLKQEINAQ